MGWFDYFERRPYDWRDDDRTYKLLQAQGAKEGPEKYFVSLHRIYKPDSVQTEDGKLSASSLKGSFIFQKMLSAKGGDKLEILHAREDVGDGN